MLLYTGVYRSKMEDFTPLSLETHGLDIREYRASQHAVPRLSALIERLVNAGIVRCSEPCPFRKIPVRVRFL